MTELLNEALAIWRDCPVCLPEFDRSLTAEQQSARESHMQRFLDSLQAEVQHPPKNRCDRQTAHARITACFADFGRTALALEDSHLELLLKGGLSEIGTRLARQARSFDPGVGLADILQASRNAWTACGLQPLFGKPMSLTPAIFAYSMLYPYTDNYMDDAGISGDEKRGFSVRLGKRLSGDGIAPANRREAIIWRLIELIESQYSRDGHPQVFESLLAIQRAQESSIRLRRSLTCDSEDILRVSFEKGGASVLADGYLAAGTLTQEQARFVFHWGVFLQLADDLQDVMEDRRDGVLTVFSHAAGRVPLDELTNRTLHFGARVMMLMHSLPGCVALKQLIQRSCLSLLIRSAGDAGEFYTKSYLEALEAHSPFRFSFLKERRTQLAKREGLLARLFEAFLAGDEDEPAFPWLPNSLMR